MLTSMMSRHMGVEGSAVAVARAMVMDREGTGVDLDLVVGRSVVIVASVGVVAAVEALGVEKVVGLVEVKVVEVDLAEVVELVVTLVEVAVAVLVEVVVLAVEVGLAVADVVV